ncbi:MAG: hypothetical protein MJA31_15915, partial [Clostridia bacterium]|nr:hypothetical protein [Clostridia bacterium]
NRFVTDSDKTNWDSAVSHISDAVKHITSAERTLWNTVSNKVDKVTGKQLSTEDYSTAEKNKLVSIATSANNYIHPSTHSMDMMTESSTKKIMADTERVKLASIEADAEVNNISNANAADLTDGGDSTLHYHSSDRNRTNHTGTQLAATISDFTTAVRGTVLAGLSTANNAIIIASDTVLSALGKLQKQISDNLSMLTNHTSNASNPHSVTKSQVGLENVDNTSDKNKPISTATQTTLNSKLGRTEKAVDSDKLDGRDSSQFQHRQVYDFYVEGDADTYYPVVIQSLYSPVDMISNIQIYRNYSWTAPDTWSTTTHKGGLCLDMNMNLYGWGGHNYMSDIMLSQQYSKMVADIRVPLPDTDSIIVWLRGGHALYRCFANVNQPITVTVYLDQYINKEGTQYENTYYPTATIIPELNKIGVLRFSSEADYIIGTGYRDVIGGKKVALRDYNNDLITNHNINFSNDDGFCYDDTQNKMYLKRDGVNCELYHEGNFDPNSKSDITHNHSAVYEPKNTNIQTHIDSVHAPSNAQKNSDITKGEIEAKLTGTIGSHTHSPDHTHSNKTVLDKLSMSGAESSFDLSNFITTDELNAAGYGDMDKSIYDTNNNGKVDVAENADSVPWSGVSGKPSIFPPSTHNHDGEYEPIFTKNSAFNKSFGTSAGTVSEGNHGHSIGNVAGLQTELDNKVTYSGTGNGYSNRTNLAVGWYTIAINSGNRAIGRFGLRDVNSSVHQSVVFYASHHFGANSDITVLHHSRFSGSPFKYIRIKEGSTYDGAMLQVYIDDSTNNVSAYLLGDNFQTSGWSMRNFVPDSTDPTGLGNYSALTNEAVKIDLDLILGGVATSGEFYSNGNKVWHEGNDGSGSGLDADTVDGKQATQLAKTMYSNGTAMNNNTTLESGFYTI